MLPKSSKGDLLLSATKKSIIDDTQQGVKVPPRGDLGGRLAILDIGTGSGCIAVALKKKFPNAEIYAVDVSTDALKVAKENAKLNDVEINFILDDILHPSFSYPKFNVIISNPPYILISEKKEMDKNVTAFEPGTALFIQDNDPLLFYRTIAKFSQKQLNPGGILYLETHRDYAEVCKTLLLKQGISNVEIRKDISGNDRMVRGFLENKCIKI
ncbi:MAG TPA: peptide chain release factor N(5)-glutamine methyltransferase [Bacteroidales bacterium]|nr:peptide chain release factor N(5)-glutamine methyltransferase [Bacteroidales bacterium]